MLITFELQPCQACVLQFASPGRAELLTTALWTHALATVSWHYILIRCGVELYHHLSMSSFIKPSYFILFFRNCSSGDEWHCVSVMGSIGSSGSGPWLKWTKISRNLPIGKMIYSCCGSPTFRSRSLRSFWRCHQDKKLSGYLRIIWFLLDISGHIILAYSGPYGRDMVEIFLENYGKLICGTWEDVDISASELENRTEAVALFLNRADTEASARDSIITTCQELRMLRILRFIYVHMILSWFYDISIYFICVVVSRFFLIGKIQRTSKASNGLGSV